MLKRKLLLADDSITIQKVVNLTFADEGIEVISVGDGDSAMIKIGEYAPDLILADVNMPGLNGYQICEQIKQNPETQKVPVILLVGSFEPFDESEAYRVGADDYLTKPFQSIRQLVTKVSDLLESADADKRIQTPETGTTAEPDREAANVHFFNTVEAAPERQFESKQFDDAGLDDEMIQTSQVGSLPVDEIQKFIADSTAGNSVAAAANSSFNDDFDFYRTVEAEEDFGKTAPLDIEDLKTFSAGSIEQQTNGAAIFEIVPEEDTENNAAQSVNQTPSAGSDSYGFGQEQNEAESMVSSPLENLSEERELASNSSVSDTPDFLFDDMDLLDLPPVKHIAKMPENDSPDELLTEYQTEDTDETVEQMNQTAQTAQVEHHSEFVSNFETEKDVEIEQAAENEAIGIRTDAETEIDRQLAALSPELIEAVARRVTEKLSDKAIREIAWEVVPQMTELIVRRMAEEKFKE